MSFCRPTKSIVTHIPHHHYVCFLFCFLEIISMIDVVNFLVSSSNTSTCHQFMSDIIIYDVLHSIFLIFIIFENDEPIIFNRLSALYCCLCWLFHHPSFGCCATTGPTNKFWLKWIRFVYGKLIQCFCFNQINFKYLLMSFHWNEW